MKGEEFLDWLSDNYLLKDSVSMELVFHILDIEEDTEYSVAFHGFLILGSNKMGHVDSKCFNSLLNIDFEISNFFFRRIGFPPPSHPQGDNYVSYLDTDYPWFPKET
jgi:hypothetical protein